jgi:outer membrane protein assembly factor BamD (BamD/ComL family)
MATRVTPPAASSLAQQVAAVDRARAALDTGDAVRARHLVDSYEAEYPSGAFTQEAEVVRIEALVREGNRAEAERVGKRFLSAYPKTPHAVRVRALLSYDP